MQVVESVSRSSITVGDLTIETEIRLIDIDALRYYAENPRIYSIIKQLGEEVSQNDVERKLWEQDSTKDLFQDIRRNGGLLEEIIVRDGEVLEGNSRLCAYRYLRKRATEEDDAAGVERWSRIRAKVVPNSIPDEAVFGILGILHIRGKARWLPYEQASYLVRQQSAFRKEPRDLAEQIGVKTADVENMIEAYKMMETYRIADPSRFSYFVEFAKSRKLADIKEYLPQGFVLEQRFCDWVKEEKLPRAEAVRDLPIILKDSSARKKFLGGQLTFEEALESARERHPESVSSFYSKLKRAAEAMRNAEEGRIRDEVAEDPQKRFIIADLYKTARKFARAVGVEVDQAGRKHVASGKH